MTLCSFSVAYQYPVHFTRAAFAPSNSLVRDFLSEKRLRQIFVVIDEAVVLKNPTLPNSITTYLSEAGISNSICILPGGEVAKKDDRVVKELYRRIDSKGLCRHSCVATLGGGAFLDVVGFAAATLHRGIPHLRFPSTLLAQADAGVGVKNGINFAGKKNLIGTFTPPIGVINDLNLLATLDLYELRAGLSEAVKVALIGDPIFMEWIESAADALSKGSLEEIEILARRCADLHIAHIAKGGDPFEQGSRRPLDFGHWAAHKLEQMSGIRHGEAVAIGIALDAIYSSKIKELSGLDLERILRLLERLGLPMNITELLQTDELLKGLDEFRQHLGGDLCITLLRGIGLGYEVHTMNHDLICDSILQLVDRQKKR